MVDLKILIFNTTWLRENNINAVSRKTRQRQDSNLRVQSTMD